MWVREARGDFGGDDMSHDIGQNNVWLTKRRV